MLRTLLHPSRISPFHTPCILSRPFQTTSFHSPPTQIYTSPYLSSTHDISTWSDFEVSGMQGFYAPEIKRIEDTNIFTHFGLEPTINMVEKAIIEPTKPLPQTNPVSEPSKNVEMELDSIVKKRKKKMKKHKLRKARKRQRFLRRRLGKVG